MRVSRFSDPAMSALLLAVALLPILLLALIMRWLGF